MRAWTALGSFPAAVLLSIIYSVLLMLTAPSLLLGSNEALHKISALDVQNTENDHWSKPSLFPLPIASFSTQARDSQSIIGSFTVLTGRDIKPLYAFFPYYVGTISIFVHGESVYRSPFPPETRFATKVNSLAVELVSADLIQRLGPSRNIEILISVTPDGGGLAVLPEILVGDLQDFETQIQLGYLYYDVIRNALLGVQVFLLVLGLTLVRFSSAQHDLLAPIIILTYLTSHGLGTVISQLRPEFDASLYIVPSTPAVSAALFLYGWRLSGGPRSREQRSAIYGFILLWMLFVVVARWLKVDLMVMNILISGPSIVAALIVVSLMCCRALQKQRSAEIWLVLFGAVSLFFLVGHDLSFRIGLHANGIALSPMGSLTFFAALSYSATTQYVASQRALAESNRILVESLRSQSCQLSQEFERSARLMRVSAAQDETARMTRELHDGVLTYLGLINIISESGATDSREQISRLSRIATNEIRVILDSRPDESASLAIALSSLRQNMVDPLSLQNIEVEWSIAELLNYGRLMPKQLMDVIRIFQEAIHNAVVRAECRSLSIIAERSGDLYTIRITNLGGKTYAAEEEHGRGITNMKSRASKLGGSLSIISRHTGATLLLYLPKIDGKAQ